MWDLVDLLQPWVLPLIPTAFFATLLLKKRRSIRVGEGVGEEDVAWLYWAGLIFFGLFSLVSWFQAFSGKGA